MGRKVAPDELVLPPELELELELELPELEPLELEPLEPELEPLELELDPPELEPPELDAPELEPAAEFGVFPEPPPQAPKLAAVSNKAAGNTQVFKNFIRQFPIVFVVSSAMSAASAAGIS